MSLLLPWLRGLRVVLHITVGLLIVLVINLTGREKRWPVERIMSWWNAVLLDIFNIQIQIHGARLEGPRLLVANHVSWLDISVIGSLEPTRFVAKSEIRHWPIAGALANVCGTFYIRRGKGGARPLLDKAVPHLKAGGSFVVFPEGTTTDGHSVLPFHARLFQAAVDAQCAVQPMALRFGRGVDGTGEPERRGAPLECRAGYAPAPAPTLTRHRVAGGSVAPFIGDDDLASHMLRLLKEPALVVDVTYCTPIKPEGLDRDTLALAAHIAIARVVSESLREPVSELEALPV